MKRIYLSLLMFVALVGNFMATAQRADYNVIPLPKEVKADSVQSFVLREGMGIYFDATNPENIRNAQFLCTLFQAGPFLTAPHDQIMHILKVRLVLQQCQGLKMSNMVLVLGHFRHGQDQEIFLLEAQFLPLFPVNFRICMEFRSIDADAGNVFDPFCPHPFLL